MSETAALDDAQRRRRVRGLTFFDTADVYEADGRSERLVGHSVWRYPGCRSWSRPRWADELIKLPGKLRAAEFPRLDRPIASQPRREINLILFSCIARQPAPSTPVIRFTTRWTPLCLMG